MITSVPLLLIGSVVAAYWYRVIRMAAKARRWQGRAANLWPAEPLGRALRFVWAPVIIIWISHPIATAFVKEPSSLLRPVWRPGEAVAAPVAWVAALVVVGCFAATILCWRRMGKSWRMGIDPAEKTPLVATGPFAYVRHPIYALSALMMSATAAAVPSPLMLTAAAIHIALLVWESSREERYLLRVHGSVYQNYRTHVGRFLPVSLRPFRTKT